MTRHADVQAVLRAVADGRTTPTDAEPLLGYLALMEAGQQEHLSVPTRRRRHRKLRALGVEMPPVTADEETRALEAARERRRYDRDRRQQDDRRGGPDRRRGRENGS